MKKLISLFLVAVLSLSVMIFDVSAAKVNTVSISGEELFDEAFSIYDEMIKQETEESKVYKALDKLEASISHNEAPISTWIDIEYKLNPVYGYEECQFNPYLKKLQNKVKEIALDKIENEGKI